MPVLIHGEEIVDLQRRLAKKQVGALRFEAEQLALDRADARFRDIAVCAGKLPRFRPPRRALPASR